MLWYVRWRRYGSSGSLPGRSCSGRCCLSGSWSPQGALRHRSACVWCRRWHPPRPPCCPVRHRPWSASLQIGRQSAPASPVHRSCSVSPCRSVAERWSCSPRHHTGIGCCRRWRLSSSPPGLGRHISCVSHGSAHPALQWAVLWHCRHSSPSPAVCR